MQSFYYKHDQLISKFSCSNMSKFVRPETLPFPEIFHKFKAKDKNSDDIIEYRVQDLPEDSFESALDLIAKHFVTHETFCVCKGIAERPKSVKAIVDYYREVIKNKLTLACFRDDKLVGLNVFIVKSKFDDKDEEVEVRFLCVIFKC